MRNPERIAGFLECLTPFENNILTSSVIEKITKRVLIKKLYKTLYQARTPYLKNVFDSEDLEYSDADCDVIIQNAPQSHKEAGFDYGWDSRFDTWYKLPMELGFVFYEMNKPLVISTTGHMLIDAFHEVPINEEKIQSVFLNALMRYQTDNPFRKNLNSNIPLVLLLRVLSLLKNDSAENGAGLFRQELSLLICWPDNDPQTLYQAIKDLRKEVGFNYSDEFMYERCLKVLHASDDQRNYYKMNQICKEAVDEYIRKMRSTGVISLRGHGRFIDMNMLEKPKIDYIMEHYSACKTFLSREDFFRYMSAVDTVIISSERQITIDLSNIRKKTLYSFAKELTREQVFEELRKVCKKQESTDAVLKFINAPTRLEFLTSIALIQQFPTLDVNPNYSVDDEGLPTFTAGGGQPDIVCRDADCDSLFEVTLMCGRNDQINNEMLPISRHLSQHKETCRQSFSVFVAPAVHEDTIRYALWIKQSEDLDIIVHDVESFIKSVSESDRVKHLLLSAKKPCNPH